MGDERHDDDILAKAIAVAGTEIAYGLKQVADALRALVPPKADKLKLSINIQGGKSMGAPVSGNVGNTFSSSVVETAAGAPVAPIGPLQFASDNPAVATVDANTGAGSLVSAGTANISVIDQGNGLTDTVAVTVSAVTPPPADKLTLSVTLNPTRR